jgi:ATP synthase in type III secretion protein N
LRGVALDLGTCALGRAIDSQGRPLDGGPPLRGRRVPLDSPSPRPNEREPIGAPLWTGVRVLDGLLTIGRGARIGIFGPPGTGKSSLVEAVVGGCRCDAVVVGLVGERGREAQRWIAVCARRMTVVCATSDRPAGERIAAARVAVAQAAALRERGLDVLLVLDSLARVAAALREAGVAAGSSTGRGGYPPSVFAEMARLVEVAGAVRNGSITLIATVLSDGDDRDPVSEAARSLLDGHIALSLRLAESGRFPAIDVPASTSRTMDLVAAEKHLHAARRLREALALLQRLDDARALGIEPAGGAGRAAVAAEAQIERFLRQGGRASNPEESLGELTAIAELLDERDARR